MRQLAILYFEGRATDEEELRLLEFIKESAHNRAAFAEWEEEWTHSHTPAHPTRGPRLHGRS